MNISYKDKIISMGIILIVLFFLLTILFGLLGFFGVGFEYILSFISLIIMFDISGKLLFKNNSEYWEDGDDVEYWEDADEDGDED